MGHSAARKMTRRKGNPPQYCTERENARSADLDPKGLVRVAPGYMSDRRIASVIRGSSVSSTSRIRRAATENMKMREIAADLRARKVELRAANAPGMRESSQKREQSMTRRLKYHAGSYTNMRRCHLSSRIQVPCSLRLYSSVSVGTYIRSIALCVPAVRLWMAIPEILLGSPCWKTFQLNGSSACQ